jgi:hypothetical protein
MSRGAYAKRCFAIETAVYKAMKEYEDVMIPKCYGTYFIRFPDRELGEDKIVSVLLLQRLRGTRLDRIPDAEVQFTSTERTQFRKQIIEIFQALESKNIFWPTVLPHCFMFSRDHQRIMAIEFSVVVFGDSLDENSKDRQRRAQRSCSNLWLEQLELNASVDDLRSAYSDHRFRTLCSLPLSLYKLIEGTNMYLQLVRKVKHL